MHSIYSLPVSITGGGAEQEISNDMHTKKYCIVLYLYIYIALLAVHTNQKC